MDRRRTALVLLLLFIVCLGVAMVLSGSRPGLQQGIAPTVAAVVGYLFAFVAAVLLITGAIDWLHRCRGHLGSLDEPVQSLIEAGASGAA